MKTIKSKRFGHWELRKNGFEQHDKTPKEFIAWGMSMGYTRKDAKRHMRFLRDHVECWYSADGRFKVAKQDLTKDYREDLLHVDVEGVTWLSVRIDNGETYMRDWKDFQAIKNDLCSPTREAFELYPSEERLHDTDNIYHMWVLPEGQRNPVGWTARDVDYSTKVSPFQRAEDE